MERLGISQRGGASTDNLPCLSHCLLDRRAAKRKETSFRNDLIAIVAPWDCLRDLGEKIAGL
jgi:hypothetical protein